MEVEEVIFKALSDFQDDTEIEAQNASESLAARVAEVTGLKPFPVVAQRIIALLSDTYFSVGEVSTAIKADPSLAASVLRMANSAFFSSSKAVASIDQAFVRLGANTVTEVVSAVATMGLFEDVGGIGKQIRDHSSATAAVVQVLVKEFASRHAKGMFLSGLLHDVGKLLLIESGETIYDADNLGEALEPDQTHLKERRALGYDHAVLGGQVLWQWKMADPVPQIVAWHHQPALAYADDEIGMSVAMLRIADAIELSMRNKKEDSEAFIEKLAAGPDCEFAKVAADDLKDIWDRITEARDNALSMFGG